MKLKYRVIVLMIGLSFSVKAQWTGTSTSSAADIATRLGRVGIGLSSTLANNELHLKAINSSNADLIFETSAGKQWSLAGRDDRFALSNWTNATTSTDYLTILDGSGNVGIGTTSPNASLQFANSVNSRKIVLYESSNNDNQVYGFGFNNFILRYQVPAANTNHVFYAGSSATASSELMRIQGNGNVGIGTATPNALLQLSNAANSRKIVLFEDVNNDNQVYGFGINSNVLRYQVSNPNANHVFYAGSSATASNELMRIQGNGNVGIGRSDPQCELHIKAINASPSADIILQSPAKQWQLSGRDDKFSVINPATGYDMLNILNSGFVGIGVLVPQNELHIKAASGAIAADILLESAAPASNQWQLSGRDDRFAVIDPANGNDMFTILNNGSIGLGIAVPLQELHIKPVSGSVSADILLQSPSGNQWQLSGRDDRFALMKGTDYFTVLNNGFVGMGTATPSVKLEVAGDIKASGSMLIGASFPTNAGLDFTNSKLAVQGKIVATQIVSSVNAWQDRVFDEDYKLMSTTEVEEYIGKHKHLPDIPSEKEVLAKGIDLAEMNSLLLKKVEEQMLYIIRLEKRVTTLETRK